VKLTVTAWEPHARSILRIILAFVFSLHGLRLLYGLFPQLARRPGGVSVPLDSLPQFTGYIMLIGAGLLFLGLLTRPSALALALVSLASYVLVAAPRALAPIRAGGNEVLLYFLVFMYFALDGGGSWSLDRLLETRRAGRA
jgi:putative oxidoreductase